MDRYWLLTWSTYGTWLPGDARGFVGRERIGDTLVARNVPGTPKLEDQRELAAASRRMLREPPVWLTRQEAAIALAQFQDTANYRQWHIFAAAIMSNHVHIVLGVEGDPDPSMLIRDLKSYASRALNERHGFKRRWWVRGASTRPLRGEPNVIAAVRYVHEQAGRLAHFEDADMLPVD